MSRIGTLGIGRIGGLGQDECPAGFFLDPNGAVCLPITAKSVYQNLPTEDLYGNLYDLGGPVVTPNIPLNYNSPGADILPYLSLPLQLAPVFAPSGVATTPGVGMSVPVSCPSGYVQSGGVCMPAAKTTLIPGVPDWVVYGGLGLLALMALKPGMGGKR